MSTESNDDPVQFYLHEVGAIPALTMQEEIELSQHVLAHDEQAESAGQRLIEANFAMVVAIAEQHGSAGIHVLELIQKGNEGLLLALNTLADSSNERFSTHSAKCVERAISNAIAESRLPRE